MEGRKYNYRYFVLNRERRRLRNAAEGYDSEKISLEKSRVCLKCGMKFSSNSPQNRLCDKCTSKNTKLAYRALRSKSKDYRVVGRKDI